MKQGDGSYHRKDGFGILYVPADVAKDSAFPFKDKDKCRIEIEGDKLTVKKLESSASR